MFAALQTAENLSNGKNVCLNCQIHKERFDEIDFMLKGLRTVIDDRTKTPQFIKAKLEQIIQELSEINPMCQ